MILAILISVLLGCIVGNFAHSRKANRHFVNYNTELRRLAIAAVVTWKAKNANECASGSQAGWYDALRSRTDNAHAMLRLSNFLGMTAGKEPKNFN